MLCVPCVGGMGWCWVYSTCVGVVVLLGSDCVEVVVLGEAEGVLGSVCVGLRWCWVALVLGLS